MAVDLVSDRPVDVGVDPGGTGLGAPVGFLGCLDHSVALVHVDPAHVVESCSDHVHGSYHTFRCTNWCDLGVFAGLGRGLDGTVGAALVPCFDLFRVP